jgi:hypothetical protein
MQASLYIRPTLRATRERIPDPGLLIDIWLDRLDDGCRRARPPLLAQGRCSGDLDEDVYDFLSTWARLCRVRPELLTDSGREADWQALSAAVKERGAELAGRALVVPDPEGWLREARQFQEAVDSPAEDADLSLWAERLLTDLDDADLAAWAARQFGHPAEALEEKLLECNRWLGEDATLFALCGVFVQAVGQTISPDLSGQDLGLAWTADKYVVLLDALEQIEALMSFPSRRAHPTGPGQLLAPAREPDPEAWSWFTPALAMAAGRGRSQTGPAEREASSRDGYTALLAFDPESSLPVRVNFFRAGAEASELAGQPAELAGILAPVDADGNADFLREELKKARENGQPLTLRVGSLVFDWNPRGAK